MTYIGILRVQTDKKRTKVQQSKGKTKLEGNKSLFSDKNQPFTAFLAYRTSRKYAHYGKVENKFNFIEFRPCPVKKNKLFLYFLSLKFVFSLYLH